MFDLVQPATCSDGFQLADLDSIPDDQLLAAEPDLSQLMSSVEFLMGDALLPVEVSHRGSTEGMVATNFCESDAKGCIMSSEDGSPTAGTSKAKPGSDGQKKSSPKSSKKRSEEKNPKEPVEEYNIAVEDLLKLETGLDQGLVPEKIIGIQEYHGIILHLVKWVGEQAPEIVPSPVLSAKYPQLVIEYYQSNCMTLSLISGKIRKMKTSKPHRKRKRRWSRQ